MLLDTEQSVKQGVEFGRLLDLPDESRLVKTLHNVYLPSEDSPQCVPGL